MCRKFLTTTSSLKHGMEVGSALPTTSTGFYNDPYIKSEKDTHLENSETGTTALWWWTWTEVGDESWFLETSWETPEYSGDTSRNLWTWFKLPSRSFSLSFWGIKNLTSLIYCKYSFPQVQAFPRPQVRHVGLQAPEALQVTVLTFAFRLFVHLECISKPLRFSCMALHFKLTVPTIRHSFLAQYDIYNVATGRLVVGTFQTKIFRQHLV